MRAFCTQCGLANEGEPGHKVMCTQCTNVFEGPEAPPDFGAASTAISTEPSAAASWGAPAVNPGLSGPLFPAPVAPSPNDPLAIASLMLSLVRCCGLIISVPALALGIVAIRRIDASGGTRGGRGLALTGAIFGGMMMCIDLPILLGAMVGGHR